MIRSGANPAGVKMPAERLIAKQMGVSRPSVRKAISALQIVGILESRPSDGTHIPEDRVLEDLSLESTWGGIQPDLVDMQNRWTVRSKEPTL